MMAIEVMELVVEVMKLVVEAEVMAMEVMHLIVVEVM